MLRLLEQVDRVEFRIARCRGIAVWPSVRETDQLLIDFGYQHERVAAQPFIPKAGAQGLVYRSEISLRHDAGIRCSPAIHVHMRNGGCIFYFGCAYGAFISELGSRACAKLRSLQVCIFQFIRGEVWLISIQPSIEHSVQEDCSGV